MKLDQNQAKKFNKIGKNGIEYLRSISSISKPLLTEQYGRSKVRSQLVPQKFINCQKLLVWEFTSLPRTPYFRNQFSSSSVWSLKLGTTGFRNTTYTKTKQIVQQKKSTLNVNMVWIIYSQKFTLRSIMLFYPWKSIWCRVFVVFSQEKCWNLFLSRWCSMLGRNRRSLYFQENFFTLEKKMIFNLTSSGEMVSQSYSSLLPPIFLLSSPPSFFGQLVALLFND